MPFWSVILSGAVFSMSLNMTIPVFFNYGGELIYPEGEAHSYGAHKLDIYSMIYCISAYESYNMIYRM